MKDTSHSLSKSAHLRRLMQLAPMARLDAMLSADNAKAIVQSLPSQDLYMTVLDLGLADSSDLVQLAAPAQFRAFVDLAAWSRDRLDPREVLAWLKAAMGDDENEFLKKYDGLDAEVRHYMLRRLMIVHDLEEHPDINPPGVTMESPEGKYLIEFLVDGAELETLRSLMQTLITQDPFAFGRMLESLRWEVASELEESAFRFRAARLSDMGFPELYDALALYAYTDPDALIGGPLRASGSEALLKPGQRVDFVEAAFRGLLKTEQNSLEDEIRFLVNSALVAEGAEPGDPQAIRRISEMARDYLQLGLEHLCHGNPDLASHIVQKHHLRRIFQVGFSLALQLRFRVDRLAKKTWGKVNDVWFLLPDLVPAIQALHQRRPLRALKVDGADPVPFRTQWELLESSALVERAEAQQQVFAVLLPHASEVLEKAMGGPLATLSPERIFAAVVAHALLDKALHSSPVSALRLSEFCERAFVEDGGASKVRDSAVTCVKDVLGEKLPAKLSTELLRMTRWTLHWLADELAGPYFTEGRVEAQFVARLPLKAQTNL